MAPVAMSGLKLSPIVAERRTKIIPPMTSSMIKLVASPIFTSGARERQRKKASAEAAASSGIPGNCFSKKFLPAVSFSAFAFLVVFLPAVCPW